MQANRCKHVRTFLIRYRSGGTPCVFNKPRRVPELQAVDEGAVPSSAPATSRLFVLSVAARRWVSTDNTLKEEEKEKTHTQSVPSLSSRSSQA